MKKKILIRAYKTVSGYIKKNPHDQCSVLLGEKWSTPGAFLKKNGVSRTDGGINRTERRRGFFYILPYTLILVYVKWDIFLRLKVHFLVIFGKDLSLRCISIINDIHVFFLRLCQWEVVYSKKSVWIILFYRYNYILRWKLLRSTI